MGSFVITKSKPRLFWAPVEHLWTSCPQQAIFHSGFPLLLCLLPSSPFLSCMFSASQPQFTHSFYLSPSLPLLPLPTHKHGLCSPVSSLSLPRLSDTALPSVHPSLWSVGHCSCVCRPLGAPPFGSCAMNKKVASIPKRIIYRDLHKSYSCLG